MEGGNRSAGKRGAGRGAVLTKSRKGLGYHFSRLQGLKTQRQGISCQTKGLEALLKFLRAVRVGELKSGALDKG